ncbi:MAG: hypothetical protein U0Z70_03845 [Thermomicrobiales bacterium]
MPRPSVTRAKPYTPRSGVVAGQTFTSERQYRNALARAKGFRSWSDQQQARSRSPGARLRPAERDAQLRAFDALAKMRKSGLSLSAAAKEAGTTVNTVKRHAGSALKKAPSGRFTPTPYDRIGRPLPVPTPDGPIWLTIRDSRSASKLGAYWSAVRHYLNTGDSRRLRAFRGRGVTINKRFYPFITDTRLLDPFADAGLLDFDDLYDV